MKLFKTLAQQINNHPLFAKVYSWIKLIGVTGSVQVGIKAIGFLSGIIIIRVLSPQEYGLYTLANTMLATMTLLADGGISAGVMAQGAKSWQDPNKLGTIFSTGFDLRKKFAIGSFLIAIPILAYLLLYHGASWLTTVLIILAIIPAFITDLSNQLLVIIPKLHQDIAPLQKIEGLVSVLRLVLVTITIFIFPWAFVAVLAAGIPQIWGNKNLFKLSNKYAKTNKAPDPLVKKEILSFVNRMLPGVIYFCLAGNITIWIASILGNTTTVAQLGALGRFSMIIGIFSVLFSTLIVPRFARMVADFKLLFKRFIQIQIGLIIFIAFIILIVWMFSSQILWILGPDYSNLEIELVMVVIGSCISLIAGASFSLYLGRGWVIHPAVSISIEIASVIIALLLIDISTIKGILLLNIFIASVGALMHTSFSVIKLVQKKV